MKKERYARTKISFAVAAGFLAGMLTMSAIVVIFPEQREPVLATGRPAAVVAEPRAVAEPRVVAPPSQTAAVPGAVPAQVPAVVPVMAANPIEELRRRHLDLPVQGAKSTDVHDMFNEKRGSDRRHEAVDLLAPRNTPVLAVEDGTIGKLFFSKAGGITIYQFDPSKTYVYYYAHLERYADGLVEDAAITRGQVIGYVGTTGNAPKDTPHLHFAIFELTGEKQWWKGTPLDPYQVFR
ncbi:MAG: peptidoglycan DD-metalloendopeptidase family protein [Vicinamibacterales bacterium]